MADSTAARLGASSRRETGKTPKELIHQFLIGQIKNALLTTEMTHQQIADQFGFRAVLQASGGDVAFGVPEEVSVMREGAMVTLVY